ncbi:MAG: ABC transporter ATP-binding protein [Geminicoccaceae bacterium]
MAQVEIRRVRKSYGKTEVVHDVDLTIREGEFVVILGPSGCGKSTLLRMIAGLESITGGEIAIDGKVVNRLEPRQRGCAMVFQNYALYPHMSVAENIGYALKVAGVNKAEREARIRQVAQTMQIEAFLDRKPSQLSGGQRQRVAMGRAIIREPKVFLFDEPLSNLDAMLRVQMRLEIRKLHQRIGATSIFVTHDQVEAMTLADRLVVLRDGVIEQVGSPSEIYDRPATGFVGGFIGSPPMSFLETSGDVSIEGLLRGWGLATPASDAFGDHSKIGIRPEHIALSAASDQPLSGQLELVEQLGDRRVCHLSVAGQLFVAVDTSDQVLEPGRTYGIAVNPARVHLFGADGCVRPLEPLRSEAAA